MAYTHPGRTGRCLRSGRVSRAGRKTISGQLRWQGLRARHALSRRVHISSW
jgi:hypothetical protein